MSRFLVLGHVRAERLFTPAQATNTYLLALAAAHGGRLATLDRRLLTDTTEAGPGALTSV